MPIHCAVDSVFVSTNTPEGLVTSIVSYSGAGTDGAWFTSDDVLSTRYTPGYDSRGLMTLQHYEIAGNDGVLGTADDAVFRWTYTFDTMGRNVEVHAYDYPGADGTWGTPDDRLTDHGVYDTTH